MRLRFFKRHRFPPEVIRHAIHATLTLSLRDVEANAGRTEGSTHRIETVRRWFLKFGPLIAAKIQRSRSRRAIIGTSMNGDFDLRLKYWLWRAVVNESEVWPGLGCRPKPGRPYALFFTKVLSWEHKTTDGDDDDCRCPPGKPRQSVQRRVLLLQQGRQIDGT